MSIYSHKVRSVTVDLPEELAAFLASVSKMIDEGDELAMIESDDLLQAERMFGGRIEEDDDDWGFTYSPSIDDDARWELVFSRTQLAAIARGQVQTLELFACENPRCKFLRSDRTMTCSSCPKSPKQNQRAG